MAPSTDARGREARRRCLSCLCRRLAQDPGRGACGGPAEGWCRQGPADPGTAAPRLHVSCLNTNTIGNISGLEALEKQTQAAQTKSANANFHVTARNHVFIKPPAGSWLSREAQACCV